MALLEVRDLTKIYRLGSPLFGAAAPGAGDTSKEVRAVDGVSFDIEPGETLGLVGESGSGKSTLGRLILRLTDATAGSVRFDGQDVLGAGASAMRRLRRQMQIIFQDPYSSLDPRMRIAEILSEPFIIHGERDSGGRDEKDSVGADRGGMRKRAAELMRAVGLEESALGRYPHEFSGGQRQRIGIARALALRPKLIVCDEPVSALDVSVGAQIVNLLARLQREFGLTYLFISHSMPVVRYLAARIAVMHRGKIVELGETEQITTRPANAYTRGLLEATPEISSLNSR